MKGKRGTRKTQAVLKPQITKKSIFISVFILLFILAGGVYYIFFYTPPFYLEYTVKPVSVEKKLVQVDLLVLQGPDAKSLEFYKGEALPLGLEAYNSRGEKLNIIDRDRFIGMNAANFPVSIRYYIELGALGKHGHRGEIYDDLLVFDGAEVLLLPSQAYTDSENQIKKYFGNLTVMYDVPSDWQSIIPFSKTYKANSNQRMTSVDSFTWAKVYELQKACFAFGKFEKLETKNASAKLNVFIDPQEKIQLTEEERQGIADIYKYYTNLISGTSPEFSLLLLRKDPKDNSYIMGGSSSQTLGTTFEVDNKRDWELMGHRFFHAFFDNAFTYNQFHAPPQLWFYEGLATYYENMSVDSLSEDLKSKLSINADAGFASLFKRYLYMSLKDPGLLQLTPMNEEKIADSSGREEFLHYTQAPLVIKAIEDIEFKKFGEHGRIIKYILQNKFKSPLSMEGIIQYALGDESIDFSRKYLYGNEVLPFWSLSNATENSQQVIKEFNDFEYDLWTWFRQEDASYPKYVLDEKGLSELSAEGERLMLHFASKDIEAKVKAYSPVTYQLLMQYALRAKTCSVDFNDPALRFKLLGDKDNVAKWQDYVRR